MEGVSKGVATNSRKIVLNVAKVSNRGVYKYAVLSGNVQLQRFKSEELAKKARKENKRMLEYLASQPSVLMANSKKTYVYL